MTTGNAVHSDDLIKEAVRQGRGDAAAGAEKRSADDLARVVAQAARAVPQGDRRRVHQAYCEAYDAVTKREVLVDAASAMSFPASDPPSYMGGASVAGAPDSSTPAEKPNTSVSDEEELRPAIDSVAAGEDTDAQDAKR